jgi:hypothetical protein
LDHVAIPSTVGNDDAVEQDEATFCGDDVLRQVFPRTDDTDSEERNPREEGKDAIKTAMPKSALILDGAMENEVYV